MAGNILYDVSTQIRAIERMEPIHTFLYDTFVRDDGAVMTEDARFDFRKGNVEIAPFVVPGGGGKNMDRNTFDTRAITFPSIAPERTLEYMNYATQRLFNEPITGNISPEERMRKLLAQDIAYLRETIQMRREWMAAQVLFYGRLDILEYLEGGQVVQATRAADYSFTNRFVPVTKWNAAGADIHGDIQLMCDMVTEGQGTPEIMIFGTDVRACLYNDEQLMKKLDTRNAYYGMIRPGKRHNALQHIGSTSDGLELCCYTGGYYDKIGGAKNFFVPKGGVLIGGEKILRCIHGPVAQVEKEGDNPKIYASKEVPFRYSKAGGSSVQQRLTSRPMIIPNNVDSWAVATVL